MAGALVRLLMEKEVLGRGCHVRLKCLFAIPLAMSRKLSWQLIRLL